MKKLIYLFPFVLLTRFAFCEPVTIERALLVATNYYQHFSFTDNTDYSVKESFGVKYNDLTTYYVFNFAAGGFVLVAADDAVVPVLGYSHEGFVEKNITKPTVKAWFDGYSKEIYEIVQAKPDNTVTLQEWNNIIDGRFTKSTKKDVGPLVSSTWDQGEWYNYYCPADSRGPGGKAYAGCAATAAGMIMKYHNFPEKGIGSHSYQSYKYGTLTADFGNTTYKWADMDTTVNSGSYQAIATLLYQFGVAVDMNYGQDKSGAYTKKVVNALVDYFNYDQSTIKYLHKDDYSAEAWQQKMRDELDKSRPIYYAGCSYEYCHAFVCDGYQSADNRFHFNWGYSGLYNGYYTIGSLNPLGNWFNLGNEVVIGIQPGNPKLVVRISSPFNNIAVSLGKQVEINAALVTGSASYLKLYINDSLITSVNNSSLSYIWNTEGLNFGNYRLKVAAMNATDTVSHSVTIELNDWITQNSGFKVPARGIPYVHAVDSSVVWATGTDGLNTKNYIQEFTRTTDGGENWTSDTIDNCSGLVPSMIFALNADTAYCPMFRQSGTNKQGIYVTRDGGKNWAHQSTAYFEFPGAFPNVVHFFNNNDGWYMGDPIFGTFISAVTTDGGNLWRDCPGARYITALSGEKGTTGYYSAVGDHIWFGTTKGRVCRSSDKGCTWDVSKTSLASETPWVDVVIDVAFADEYHGLAQDRSKSTKGAISETFDGGITWKTVTTTGPVYYGDLVFVPGTGNTWISTGFSEEASGISYSYDGGHTWQLFNGLKEIQCLAMDWISNHCGWVGSFGDMSNNKGFYKYAGKLPETAFTAPLNLAGTLTGREVNLTWDSPNGTLLPVGYNVYRNNQLLTPIPVTTQSFNDKGLDNANYRYCVSAVYSGGESTSVCMVIDIAVAIDEFSANSLNIFPNPVSSGLLTVNSDNNFKSVLIYNSVGQLVYENNYSCKNLQIITTSFKPGIYLIQIDREDGLTTQKVIIQ